MLCERKHFVQLGGEPCVVCSLSFSQNISDMLLYVLSVFAGPLSVRLVRREPPALDRRAPEAGRLRPELLPPPIHGIVGALSAHALRMPGRPFATLVGPPRPLRALPRDAPRSGA